MYRLASLLNKAKNSIDKCDSLLDRVPGGQVASGDEVSRTINGLKSSVATVKAALGKIDPDIVADYRKRKNATDLVLDDHVKISVNTLSGYMLFGRKGDGAADILRKLREKDANRLDKDTQLDLGKVQGEFDRLAGLLYLMVRPVQAFLRSWQFCALIVILGVFASFFAYSSFHIRHAKTPGSPVRAVSRALSKDSAAIKSAGNDAEGSPLKKAAASTEEFGDVLPPLTKVITEMTALIAAIQALISFRNPKKA